MNRKIEKKTMGMKIAMIKTGHNSTKITTHYEIK